MKLKHIVVASAFAFAFVATPASAQTIVEIAQSDDTFSSLVDAVVAQDLVDTLSSEGPFTVFAPTNDAFAALPSYVADALATDPDLLTDILLYHVAPGSLMAADVLALDTIETAQGESVNVQLIDGAPNVDVSEITATDIMADNGVVHVIDEVLLPNSVYDAVLMNFKRQLDLIQLTLAARG